jgi:hypothetical protein
MGLTVTYISPPDDLLITPSFLMCLSMTNILAFRIFNGNVVDESRHFPGERRAGVYKSEVRAHTNRRDFFLHAEKACCRFLTGASLSVCRRLSFAEGRWDTQAVNAMQKTDFRTPGMLTAVKQTPFRRSGELTEVKQTPFRRSGKLTAVKQTPFRNAGKLTAVKQTPFRNAGKRNAGLQTSFRMAGNLPEALQASFRIAGNRRNVLENPFRTAGTVPHYINY